MDNSRGGCLLSHTLQGVLPSPLASKEDPGPQCTFSIDGHPASYSGLEVPTSSQPHLQSHSTLVPEFDWKTYDISVYNEPNTQLSSLTQLINTRSVHDRWDMQDHTGEVLGSGGQMGNEDVSKCAGSPLVPRIAAQATMTSHCNGSYAQCAARFTSVGGRGMAPSSKPRSACRPPKHTSQIVHDI